MILSCASATRKLISAGNAAGKVGNLEHILTTYYPNWTPYNGKDPISDVKTALKYVVSKKKTKVGRKIAGAAASTAFGVAGAAIGGAAGSFALPGVGTAVGAITVGQIVGAAPTVGERSYRGVKKVYKWVKGTQGVHRTQAATALYNAYMKGDMRSSDYYAAEAGLLCILHGVEELEYVQGNDSSDNAIDRIASRMKSW